MIKKLTALVPAVVFAVLCLFSAPAHAEEYEDYYIGVIEDYQDALTDSEERELLSEIQSAADDIGINVGVVLTDGLDGRSSQAFTDSFLDYRFGAYSDSIVLMLVKAGTNEQDWISYSNKAYDLYSGREDSIFDAVYSGLDRGGNNYHEAIREFCSYIKSHRFSLSLTLNMFTLVGLVFAVAIALIVAGNMARGYSKKAPISARRYLDGSRTNYLERTDVYVREYTTSHKISSSSGGHGGRGGGGGRRGGGGGRRR